MDAFEIATANPVVASIVPDEINEYLTFMLKLGELVTLFNEIDLLQIRDYIKILVEIHLEGVCEKHTKAWIGKSINASTKQRGIHSRVPLFYWD